MPVWRVSKCDVAIFFHKIQVCSFENKTEQRKKNNNIRLLLPAMYKHGPRNGELEPVDPSTNLE